MSEPIARCTKLIRLRPDVSVAADGQLTLTPGARPGEHLGSLRASEIAALRALAAGALTEPELTARLGPASSLADRLLTGGWLTVAYGHSGRPLITVRPLGPPRDPHPAPPGAARLSRFAVLRRDGDALLLESPLARAAITVHDSGVVALIHHLARSASSPPRVGLPPDIVAELVAVLAWYGFVDEAEEDVRPVSEEWSPHELWFHSHSRVPQAAEERTSPPARGEAWPGVAVALPSPESDMPTGPTFSAVLEARHGVRDAAPGPLTLTLARLGEFLHWTARARTRDVPPHPSGLEIYPVVASVSDLAPGMYHYDPYDHLLEPVPATEPATSRLLARAAAAAGGTARPAVLLVITARFGPAYALILKDLGALLQTMYLVATSMGLTPHPIGAGDTELFAKATGLDQLVEASVGELLLGIRAK